MNVKLQKAREAAGKTQAQVAQEADISRIAYQNYELGRNAPNVFTAIRIAGTLNATVETLFGEKAWSPFNRQPKSGRKL